MTCYLCAPLEGEVMASVRLTTHQRVQYSTVSSSRQFKPQPLFKRECPFRRPFNQQLSISLQARVLSFPDTPVL